jgi:hypothetical protein
MADHIYEIAVAKTTTAAAIHIATILGAAPAASTRAPEIREIGITLTSAVAAEVGLGFPAAAGTGGNTTVSTAQAVNAADPAGHTLLVSAFTTLQPTAPTNFFRRSQLPGVIGAGIIWVWQPGEFILQNFNLSGNLCLWQFTASVISYDVYVKVAE